MASGRRAALWWLMFLATAAALPPAVHGNDGAAGGSAVSGFDSSAGQEVPQPGATRDQLSGITTAGVSIGQVLEDGPAIVHFWAEWCAVCRRELVELGEYYRASAGQLDAHGVKLLLISNDPTPGIARRMLARLGLTAMPVLHDPYFDFNARLSGTRGVLPMTYLVRRDGSSVPLAFGRFEWSSGAVEELVVPQLLPRVPG